MRFRLWIPILFGILSVFGFLLLPNPLSATPKGEANLSDGKLTVFASILPQAYLIERIGGERVAVEVLIQPGQDPHLASPTPRQLARLAEAELYFRIGVEFENPLMPWMESTMRELVVVDCRKGVQLRQVESHERDAKRVDEGDGSGETSQGEKASSAMDPHIWLSVHNAAQISRTVRDALIRLDPSGQGVYEEGYRRLEAELTALDREIADLLTPLRGKSIMVFHPSFGYFADDYGLKQLAVETGGSEPSARQLANLIDEALEQDIRVVFVQPQFSLKSAEAVAQAINGVVVPIDPLARDYMENLKLMAKKIREGLL